MQVIKFADLPKISTVSTENDIKIVLNTPIETGNDGLIGIEMACGTVVLTSADIDGSIDFMTLAIKEEYENLLEQEHVEAEADAKFFKKNCKGNLDIHYGIPNLG